MPAEPEEPSPFPMNAIRRRETRMRFLFVALGVLLSSAATAENRPLMVVSKIVQIKADFLVKIL